MRKSVSFVLACWLLIAVLYVRLLWPRIAGGGGSAMSFGMEGMVRLLCLGIIIVILVDHLNRFSFVFRYEKNFITTILAFLFLMVAQVFIVGNISMNLQGSVKYFYYFGFLAIALYGTIVYSDHSIRTLLNASMILFFSVLIFYPYLIVNSGQDPLTRLLSEGNREHFLLGASNEDAHFMTTLFMLVFVKVRKHKLLTIALACLFYLALIYNGTRSALVIAFLLPIIFYILYKRKFVMSAIVVSIIVILTLPYLTTFFQSKFEKDLAILDNTEKVVSGQEHGGSLAFRITRVWAPTITHTLKRSPFVGFGSNGFYLASQKVLGEAASPHNFFIWTFVNWGFIGLFLMLMLFYIPISYAWKAYMRESNQDELFTIIALLCAWFQFIVWSMVANSDNAEGWVILCMLIVFSIAIKYKDFSRDLLSTHEGINRKHA